jgi:hypothetical protein
VAEIDASWFEARGVAALLTTRIQDLINAAVSKDEAAELESTRSRRCRS